MLKKKRKRSLQYKNESKVIDSKEARSKRKAKRDARQELSLIEQKSVGKKTRKKNKGRFIYGAIILVMIALIVMTIYSVIAQNIEYKRVKEEQQSLVKEKTRLEYELKQVDTLEYVEEQARRLLKMIKPGEILYIIPEKEVPVD